MESGGAYYEVYVYAGTRGRETFILQHVVDAHAAQTADEKTKPITIVFGLAGRYFHVERGLSGLEVRAWRTRSSAISRKRRNLF